METEKQSQSCHWILIRGLAREARHWGDFPSVLQDALIGEGFTDTRVDAVDLPGTGRYSEMKSPLSIHETAGFVRGKVQELRARLRAEGEEPPRRIALLAVSLGGMVATEWMKEWPQDLAGAVLVNTSYGKFSRITSRLRPTALVHLAKILSSRDAVSREEAILKMVSHRTELHRETAKAWARFALERPMSPENFTRQLFAASRFSTEIERPPVPVLVLASENDRMVNISCSEAIAQRWGSEIQRHADAGHDLPLDEPRWAATQIAQWAARRLARD